MPEQILSQEEIDALLVAMDKGNINLEEEEESEIELTPFDLTSQSKSLPGQFQALEEVYDKFATMLGDSLSSSLQRNVNVEFVSKEMVKFGEFLESFSNPTGFSIFNMEPLIGSAMLAIEADLAFCLIDCMFGGVGKPLEQMREFTLIEQRMLKKFAVEVLQNLEKAWSPVCPLEVSLKKTETRPEFVRLVTPGDLVIVVRCSISGEEFTGNIHQCIPYLMLEPIKDRLSSVNLVEAESENMWSSQFGDLLGDAQVELTAELGRVGCHTVRDLLNLDVGNLIRLNTSPQDPVDVMVETVPKYRGFPGVVKGSRAIEITGLQCKNGDRRD